MLYTRSGQNKFVSSTIRRSEFALLTVINLKSIEGGSSTTVKDKGGVCGMNVAQASMWLLRYGLSLAGSFLASKEQNDSASFLS